MTTPAPLKKRGYLVHGHSSYEIKCFPSDKKSVVRPILYSLIFLKYILNNYNSYIPNVLYNIYLGQECSLYRNQYRNQTTSDLASAAPSAAR
jgi:hypothetical protein